MAKSSIATTSAVSRLRSLDQPTRRQDGLSRIETEVELGPQRARSPFDQAELPVYGLNARRDKVQSTGGIGALGRRRLL
jgi:hypothetical protein